MLEQKVPPDRPALVLRDKGAADMATLEEMGVVKPQPKPVPTSPPGPSPNEQANEAAIQAALLDAGVSKVGRDEQVIDALAKLDPADIAALTRWLRAKQPADAPK